MSNIILKVENLSKQYRLGVIGTGTVKDDLKRWWYGVRGKQDPFKKIGEENDRTAKGTSNYVWALKDINFEVKQGEVLGIIGKNGAGKSTLLKILSKITSPTTGIIKSKGTVASLLEVGTGFHAELTGRENIYLNGAILGMTKKEIASKIDEIIEFSGCERYIDTPVKRYSSGMTVRLAFAVAAFLEPDILIIDEVLAVGDAEFQKKAIGKMQDISRGGGRTVLFVSHDMNAISILTQRVIVLKHGKVCYDGGTDLAIKEYLKGESNEVNYLFSGDIKKPTITHVFLDTSLPNNVHEYGKPISFIFKLKLPFKVNNLALSFQIIDEFQNPITHVWIIDSQNNIKREKGLYEFKCEINNPKLYMGEYSLRIYLSDSKTKDRFDYLESVCGFKIQMMKTERQDFKWNKGACKYLEDATWSVIKEA
ncbi:ABC transporter ATP-binding protein [Seonamhaeicola algicola]|uniref:ABC transporter ATP-binding protein n=1 Tax=Seonamhaeicola algicola TaxID=1719036 RepID=A0A5C7ATI2_9FLAO|nr:ABC transporter ATP-binding protein [Seonamhaeicola algicola]TXE12046.1 ABC transporter ATP-binding protein [Seonamhaeicola algicola]